VSTFPFGKGGPFTADLLREIIHRPRDHDGYVLTDNNLQRPRAEDLPALAFALNDITGAFRFSKEKTGASRVLANDVNAAWDTFDRFFEARARECRGYPENVVADERKLHAAYEEFRAAFARHSFDLDMDVAGLMPEHENWHSVAKAVAASFQAVLSTTNKNIAFGYSSHGGPLARFVAAVVPMITGETPTAESVSKHLQRQRKRRTGDK
jgi:hypothetical protein